MLSRFVPTHVNDPFGLVARMLRSRKKAAVFTLWVTGLAVLLTPVDYLLQWFEKRRYAELDTTASTGPHIIVCGPARSGTTLVYQVLADALDIAFIRNFTVLFSRSPILTSRWFTRKSKGARPGYDNYYGKTSGMQAPSEANHIWNQWVRSDASDFRTILDEQGVKDMQAFMTNFSASQNAPTLYKNNNANAFADVIARSLSNTYFICLSRDPVYLSQSLIQARKEINGNIEQSYGVRDVSSDGKSSDPVDEVVEQVKYLNDLAMRQQALIGEERFWIVSYEEFCENPSALIQRVRRDILGVNAVEGMDELPAFINNNKSTDPALLQRIKDALASRAN